MMLSLDLHVELIEKPFAARILVVLYRFGSLNRGLLYDTLGSGPTTPIRRIDELEAAGLVEEIVSDDRKRYIKLTEKGLRVAILLDDVDRALRDTK